MALPFGNPAFPTDPSTPLLRLSPTDDLYLEDFWKNFLFLGATGSGKTSSSKILEDVMLRAGFGGVIFCVKQGERDNQLRRIAAAGRTSSVILVDGSAKHRINPIHYQMATSPDPAALIMNTVKMLSDVTRGVAGKVAQSSGSDRFFDESSEQALNCSLMVLLAAYGQANLYDIQQLMTSRPSDAKQLASAEWQRSFMGETLRLAQENPKVRIPEMDLRSARTFLTQTFGAKADHRTAGSIQATVDAQLAKLSTGRMREIFAEGSTFCPEQTFDGALILVDLPYETYGEAGLLGQMIIKHLFQKAVLARPRTKNMRPLLCWMDEAHMLLAGSGADAEFLSLSREACCTTVMLTQSLSGMFARIGSSRPQDAINSILNGLTTKFACANADYPTNEWFSNMVGKNVQYRYNGSSQEGGGINEGLTRGGGSSYDGQKGSSNSSWSITRGGSLSWSNSIGWNENMDFDLQPGDFTRLRTGGRRNNYKVDSIVFRAGTPFRHSGKNFMPVTFKQR